MRGSQVSLFSCLSRINHVTRVCATSEQRQGQRHSAHVKRVTLQVITIRQLLLVAVSLLQGCASHIDHLLMQRRRRGQGVENHSLEQRKSVQVISQLALRGKCATILLGLGFFFWDAGVIAAERRQQKRGSKWRKLSNLVYRAR